MPVRILQARQNVELVGCGEQSEGTLSRADGTGQHGLDVLAGVELAQLLHYRRVQGAATVQKVGTFNESLNVHRQHRVRIAVRPACQKVSSRLLQEDALGVAGQGRSMLQHGTARQRHPLDDVVGTTCRTIGGQAHVSPLRQKACAWQCFHIPRASARRASDQP